MLGICWVSLVDSPCLNSSSEVLAGWDKLGIWESWLICTLLAPGSGRLGTRISGGAQCIDWRNELCVHDQIFSSLPSLIFTTYHIVGNFHWYFILWKLTTKLWLAYLIHLLHSTLLQQYLFSLFSVNKRQKNCTMQNFPLYLHDVYHVYA